MGCNCGKSRQPAPVDENAPDPNEDAPVVDGDAWWQANPALPPTAAVPMPS